MRRTEHGSLDELPPNLRITLAKALKQGLPGPRAQRRFAPELSYGRQFGPADSRVREAAVVALLCPCPDRNAWYLPLTLRSHLLADHAGQISLPGGALEGGEDDRQAALRELSEELGVSASHYKLLGRLSPLYVFVSNFRITPWLAVADSSPDLRPEPEEVDEILKVPLTHLVDERNHGRHSMTRGTINFAVPHITWNGHRIWGATAMILGELAELLQAIHDETY